MKKLLATASVFAVLAGSLTETGAASPEFKLDNKGVLSPNRNGVHFDVTFACQPAQGLSATAYALLYQETAAGLVFGFSQWVFPVCDGEPRTYGFDPLVFAGFLIFEPGRALFQLGCTCTVLAKEGKTSREVRIVEAK